MVRKLIKNKDGKLVYVDDDQQQGSKISKPEQVHTPESVNTVNTPKEPANMTPPSEGSKSVPFKYGQEMDDETVANMNHLFTESMNNIRNVKDANGKPLQEVKLEDDSEPQATTEATTEDEVEYNNDEEPSGTNSVVRLRVMLNEIGNVDLNIQTESFEKYYQSLVAAMKNNNLVNIDDYTLVRGSEIKMLKVMRPDEIQREEEYRQQMIKIQQQSAQGSQ